MKLGSNVGMPFALHGQRRQPPHFSSSFAFTGRLVMEKKSSASSRPAGLKSMKSEDIKRRNWTKREVEAVQRVAALQASGDDSGINFEDIPRLSKAQLDNMVRLRDRKKIAVSVRLDPQVLAWLKSKGSGHLTRINDILTNLMEAELRAKRTG